MRRTLILIKPDAFEAGHVGNIMSHIEKNKFRYVAFKTITMSQYVAGKFYIEHKEKDFYRPLVDWIKNKKMVALVVEREDAINYWRKCMIDVRREYGTSIQQNAVHGSDSEHSAMREIDLLFPELPAVQISNRSEYIGHGGVGC